MAPGVSASLQGMNSHPGVYEQSGVDGLLKKIKIYKLWVLGEGNRPGRVGGIGSKYIVCNCQRTNKIF